MEFYFCGGFNYLDDVIYTKEGKYISYQDMLKIEEFGKKEKEMD